MRKDLRYVFGSALAGAFVGGVVSVVFGVPLWFTLPAGAAMGLWVGAMLED